MASIVVVFFGCYQYEAVCFGETFLTLIALCFDATFLKLHLHRQKIRISNKMEVFYFCYIYGFEVHSTKYVCAGFFPFGMFCRLAFKVDSRWLKMYSHWWNARFIVKLMLLCTKHSYFLKGPEWSQTNVIEQEKCGSAVRSLVYFYIEWECLNYTLRDSSYFFIGSTTDRKTFSRENSMSFNFCGSMSIFGKCVLSYRAFNRNGRSKKGFREISQLKQHIGISEYLYRGVWAIKLLRSS